MQRTAAFLALLLSMQCTTERSDAENTISGEFKMYGNGLIYSDATMSQIKILVDSLNLRFKSCEPKTFRSLEQGHATYLSVTSNLKGAREAIRKNISLDQFIERFPATIVIKNTWVVKEQAYDEGKEKIRYTSLDDDYKYISPDPVPQNQTEGWVYEDHDEEIEAFYLHGLKSVSIPEEYARLIQYVDCVIDTTTTIFPTKAQPYPFAYNLADGSKVKEFIDIAMDFEPEPQKPPTDESGKEQIRGSYEKYQKDRDDWNIKRMAALDNKMHDPETSRIFSEAVEEAITNQNGRVLDEYAERYLPPAKTLELKRSFVVHGFCGADTGPRRHAQAICVLAAESRQWDIFLRAHLDILNDNFQRSSDGSYAWHSRGTYIKELEESGINAVDLLVGTTLSSKDISKNHYLAATSRVGRALAESSHGADVEDLLLRMAQDDRFDIFNRTEMLYVLVSYNRYAKTRELYLANLPKIKQAVSSLPEEVQSRYSRVLDD